ncbi:MAG: hypothetical protein A3G59_00255 [Candidatus Taylorbacteria bacterium RIFCSPLOWO2_12_FULL_47_20]|uniref:Winged helix-turn helix domain-containing protein n=1 Tax=Candidatus Taylorbacteria bacterium RIFCSPLOWO2_12_FULL_47_20 TaxID=1802335 RepID=A0A1G2PAN7_9BACT|nr:MAG: hypothetical protein A3G59_00255 [Candidatus Taylorbacteria bacterium RIFCSPLOWO2_12_FULL_47_20]
MSIHPNRALSIEELEKRRYAAGRLFDIKKTAYFVARKFGVAIPTARDWKRRWEEGTLAAQPQGRTAKLTPKQETSLAKAILDGPEKQGYATQLWTLERITSLIRDAHKIAYRPRSVWHLMGRLGFSCQRPERRSKERDEAAILRWRKTEWPRLRKKGLSSV